MAPKATAPDQLTWREREILALLSQGLSDQQIAATLFLSPNTVRWYNRQIYSKLGVGSRTQAIMHARVFGLLDQGALLPTDSRSAGRLPVFLTELVGRTREIAEVQRFLRGSRLLTVTGPGGVGKTRLAVAAAELIAPEFKDGVYFVDLASISDAALVSRTVAQALGVGENSAEPALNTLKRVLASSEALLLIDNFEHVIAAAPDVSELIAAAPNLKVLITSREVLRLAGEQEYPVPPLSLPEGEKVAVERLLESEAGALFVQRARMAQPDFTVNDANAAAIAQICARLDGLPLAIELAAARSKLLNPPALLGRLAGDESPLGTLAIGPRDGPPRHRTLRDTMAWSYNLLSDSEKILFARLAVFQGGRSLEAVEVVCGSGLPADVFNGLASLVDKCLVQQKESASGEPRFTMLEMIHEYAREQLEASGEAAQIRQRHAAYFVDMVERAEPALRMGGYDEWCRIFEQELANLRAALAWSLDEGDITLGVRLASALGMFWYGKGLHVEGIGWIQRLTDRLDEAPVSLHPKFLVTAGYLAWMHDLDIAQNVLMGAVEIAQALDDRINAAWALSALAYALARDPVTATPLADDALTAFREMDHLPGIAQTLNIIGEIARINGDSRRAREAYEECLDVCRQTGESRRTGYMWINLAYLAQYDGDHERAIALGRRALQLSTERGDRSDMATALMLLAGSLAATGKPQVAARLLGTSTAVHSRMGALQQPTDALEIERITAEVTAQLGEAAFQEAWHAGQSMTLEQAVTVAQQGA